MLESCPWWVLIGFGVALGAFPDRLWSAFRKLEQRNAEKRREAD